MMSAANKKLSSRAGQYIVELAVVIAATGIILTALGPLIDSVFQFYGRQKINQLYSLHIDPFQRLVTTQVPKCRYRVYADYSAANSASIDYTIMTNVVSSGNALRCDLLDKSGAHFIVSYNPATHRVLVTSFSSSATGNKSKSFILSNSLYIPSGAPGNNMFDISLGFLQVWCALKLPAYHNMNAFFQVDDTANRLIEYVLVGERQQ